MFPPPLTYSVHPRQDQHEENGTKRKTKRNRRNKRAKTNKTDTTPDRTRLDKRGKKKFAGKSRIYVHLTCLSSSYVARKYIPLMAMFQARQRFRCCLCRIALAAARAPPRTFYPSLSSSPFLSSSLSSSPSSFARGYAVAAKRKKPARLVLSPRVASPTAKSAAAASSSPAARQRKKSAEPNFGLNRTVANISPKHARRHVDARDKARDKDKDGKPKKEAPAFRHMKMRRVLHEVSQNYRSSVKERIEELNSFADLGLMEASVLAAEKDALRDLETVAPTPVQRVAIPAILGTEKRRRPEKVKAGPQQFLIAAETGSGKTLAYLLPVLDQVKRDDLARREAERARREEEMRSNDGLVIPKVDDAPKNGKPRAVILLPTVELVEQVGSVLKSLTHAIKLRTAFIHRDLTPKVIHSRLFSAPLDVLVSTPQLLESVAEPDPDFFENTTHVVCDEADSLFDRSFAPTTQRIVQKAYNHRQLILCSATIPQSLDAHLRKRYPDMRRLVTPNLHAIPRRVQLSLVDSDADPYRGNKYLACADTLYNIAKEPTEDGFVKKVVVFVNERDAAAPLAEFLRGKSIDAVEFERDAEGRSKGGLLEYFSGPKEAADAAFAPSRRMKVLVATDIASRGIDTKHVRTVVLFDVPHTTVDFIHRIGRTGRMGRRGRAILLVDRKTDKGWIKEIKTSMHMGSSLT